MRNPEHNFDRDVLKSLEAHFASDELETQVRRYRPGEIACSREARAISANRGIRAIRHPDSEQDLLFTSVAFAQNETVTFATSNNRAALDAAMTLLSQMSHCGRRASERARSVHGVCRGSYTKG